MVILPDHTSRLISGNSEPSLCSTEITACALVPELAHPRVRHMAGGFLNTTYFVSCSWKLPLQKLTCQIGSIFSAWLTFAMVYYPGSGTNNWSWRIPTLIQGFGPIILALGVWFVPQSPRWLVKKGRADEAHKILAKYHANGDLDDPLVQLEMREIQAAVTLEEISNTGSWKSFVSTIGNRRRFFVIIMIGTATQWIGNGLVSYFLVPILRQVGITSPPQLSGINGGIAIFSWLAAMGGASLSDRFGRRSLFLTSLAGALVSFVFITGLSGGFATTRQSKVGIAMIPFLFIFNGFYALAFTPIPMLYCPEVSPFSLRAKSAALLLLSQNIAQAFNQFVNPVALAAIQWKYYIVYVAVISIYIGLFWMFCRETKGLTVEEAAVVYEPDSYREKALEQERQLLAMGTFESKATKKETHEEEKLGDELSERGV